LNIILVKKNNKIDFIIQLKIKIKIKMIYNEIDNKDQMWYKLGLHFCKLREYCQTIYWEILNRQFGKSHKLVKKFKILNNKFIYLAGTLDDIIQKDYPCDVYNLESLETKPYITSVFYRLYHNDDDEQIIYNEKMDDTGINKILQFRHWPISKYPKNFTHEEKKFIDTFIQNLNEYLVNITFLNMDNLNDRDNKLYKNISEIQRYITKLIPEISQVPVFN